MFTVRKLHPSKTDMAFYLEILKNSTITEEHNWSLMRTFSEVYPLGSDDISENNWLEWVFGVFSTENTPEKIIWFGAIRQPWKNFSRGNHNFHIGPIYILPDFRWKWLGIQIMQALENEALNLTTSKIIKFDLGVTYGLDSAMKLYLSLWYNIIWTDPKYMRMSNGEYLDRALMIKILNR